MRAPKENINHSLQQFYDKLLGVLRQSVVREGQWQLLECMPAWDGNASSDSFVSYAWHGRNDEKLLVAVNYSPFHSQCYVRLPFTSLDNEQWLLQDLLGDGVYERAGNDLIEGGLFLDVPPWQAHIFSIEKLVPERAWTLDVVESETHEPVPASME